MMEEGERTKEAVGGGGKEREREERERERERDQMMAKQETREWQAARIASQTLSSELTAFIPPRGDPSSSDLHASLVPLICHTKDQGPIL